MQERGFQRQSSRGAGTPLPGRMRQGVSRRAAKVKLGCRTRLLITVITAIVARKSRRIQFFLLTLLFLGPLELAAAAIAQPRDPMYFAPPACSRTAPPAAPATLVNCTAAEEQAG